MHLNFKTRTLDLFRESFSFPALFVFPHGSQEDNQGAQGEEQEQAGNKGFHGAREHVADVRIDNGGGELPDAGGDEERPEAHGSEPGGIADDIEGNKGQQPSDEDGVFAVVFEKLIHPFQGGAGGEFFHHVPAEIPGDIEAQSGPGHGAGPG